MARVELAMNAHGFVRIDVIRRHEPARLIGADGDRREIERTVPATDLAEVSRVAGLAGEEKAGVRLLDDPSGP